MHIMETCCHTVDSAGVHGLVQATAAIRQESSESTVKSPFTAGLTAKLSALNARIRNRESSTLQSLAPPII
jgi:hypothetical protein